MKDTSYLCNSGEELFDDDALSKKVDRRKIRKPIQYRKNHQVVEDTSSQGNKKQSTVFDMPIIKQEKGLWRDRKKTSKPTDIAEKHPAPVASITVVSTKTRWGVFYSPVCDVTVHRPKGS